MIHRNPATYLHKYQPAIQGVGIDSSTVSAVRCEDYDSLKYVERDALKSFQN